LKIIREEKLAKIYTIATLLAVILAIASAFVAIPMSAAALLVLGGIGAINFTPEMRLRVYSATTVLILGAKSLSAIPAVGDVLAAIFSAVGTSLIGASIVSITLAIFYLIKTSLSK
jgi:hypothetical protein